PAAPHYRLLAPACAVQSDRCAQCCNSCRVAGRNASLGPAGWCQKPRCRAVIARQVVCGRSGNAFFAAVSIFLTEHKQDAKIPSKFGQNRGHTCVTRGHPQVHLSDTHRESCDHLAKGSSEPLDSSRTWPETPDASAAGPPRKTAYPLRLEAPVVLHGGTMKYLNLPGVAHPSSNIILGLMRISDKTDEEIRALYETARENGINFIDHANIYGGNNLCERRWAEA